MELEFKALEWSFSLEFYDAFDQLLKTHTSEGLGDMFHWLRVVTVKARGLEFKSLAHI